MSITTVAPNRARSRSPSSKPSLMKGVSTPYSSSLVLKKAQTCRDGSRIEPASRTSLGVIPHIYEIRLKFEKTLRNRSVVLLKIQFWHSSHSTFHKRGSRTANVIATSFVTQCVQGSK